MEKLKDKWNKNKFSIYDSEEKTVLKTLENTYNWLSNFADEVDQKTYVNGDHKGSWQGLNKPTLSEEGMRATVEKHVTDITNLDNSLNEITQKTNFVTPENFGAKGGTNDDSTPFVNMIAFAKSNNVNVKLIKKRYKVTRPLDFNNINVSSDINTILEIRVDSNTHGQAFLWGGNSVNIKGVTFELYNANNLVKMQGLYNSNSNVKNQKFNDNVVIGKTFANDGNGNIYGLWINSNGYENLYIKNNVFENVNYPIQVNQQQGETGSILSPLGNPLENIFIENNSILNGTIGINTPHVYCKNVFIKNNKVSSNTGFNVNIAHVENWVVDGNILNGNTITNDSVIHIEDVSYKGKIINNIINNNDFADGIRILSISKGGISKDPFVPTDSITVSNNDIIGVGNASGVSINDTYCERVKIQDNRIVKQKYGITTNSEKTEIINNQIKDCETALYITKNCIIDGLTIENCNNVIRTTVPVTIKNIKFYDTIPNLLPSKVTGTTSLVTYDNLMYNSNLTTMETDKYFDILTLPSGKFEFTMTYKIPNITVSKINVKYDETTLTSTVLYNNNFSNLGGLNLTIENGILKGKHFINGSPQQLKFYINIDSITYTN